MSEQHNPMIYIVDDDAAVRDSVQWLLESVGLKVQAFARAQDFLEAYQPKRPGCLLLDMRMPDMSGLQVQKKLLEYGIDLPVIIITGHGDVPMAVAAMKHGAVDFIEKPCNDQLLLECVQNALVQDQSRRHARAFRQDVLERLTLLTPREREVMEQVVQGMSNKAIADALDVSCKTVEVHRAKVMDKMQAGSLSGLIRMAMVAGMLKEYTEDDES